MAGMRPFVLSEKFRAAYCLLLAAAGCPSSQIAIDKLSAVPLWKVIVGPAPTNCKPGPQGSGFLLRAVARHLETCAHLSPNSRVAAAVGSADVQPTVCRSLARTGAPIYSVGLKDKL